MKAISSFFQPLAIRFRARKLCFCCGAPATRKCRTHATRICESADCKMEHRRLKASVYGNLTRPFCEYGRLFEGMDWVVAIGAAITVVVGVAVVVVHI